MEGRGGKVVNNVEGAITISQSQIVKMKTLHLLIDKGERGEERGSSFRTISDTCVIYSIGELLRHMVR